MDIHYLIGRAQQQLPNGRIQVATCDQGQATCVEVVWGKSSFDDCTPYAALTGPSVTDRKALLQLDCLILQF